MRRIAFFIVILAMMSGAGCAGMNYTQQREEGNLLVTQGGRTGAFGTDNSWVHIQEKPNPDQPAKIRLEKTYSKSVTAWTGCPDRTPNRNAKNIRREEVREEQSEEVLNPNASSHPPVFSGGSNPSTGNMFLPAAAVATGVATSGALLPGSEGDVTVIAPKTTSGASAGAGANASADATAIQKGRVHSGGSSHQNGGACTGNACP